MPALRGPVTGPGTAPTCRPRSAAISAVMSEPDRSCASTTTVAAASPAMIRFRAGNAHFMIADARRQLGHDAAVGRIRR